MSEQIETMLAGWQQMEMTNFGVYVCTSGKMLKLGWFVWDLPDSFYVRHKIQSQIQLIYYLLLQWTFSCRVCDQYQVLIAHTSHTIYIYIGYCICYIELTQKQKVIVLYINESSIDGSRAKKILSGKSCWKISFSATNFPLLGNTFFSLYAFPASIFLLSTVAYPIESFPSLEPEKPPIDGFEALNLRWIVRFDR